MPVQTETAEPELVGMPEEVAATVGMGQEGKAEGAVRDEFLQINDEGASLF